MLANIRVNMQNFVNIGQTVLEILQFFDFQDGGSLPCVLNFQNFKFLVARRFGSICITVRILFFEIGQTMSVVTIVMKTVRWNDCVETVRTQGHSLGGHDHPTFARDRSSD